MSRKTRVQTRAQANRQTVIYAVATFLALTIISIAGWALTRPEAAVQAATPTEPASAPQTFERITAEELKAAIAAGEVVVIDVRSVEQYDAAHIPNALHIPVSRIEGEIPYLPKGKTIVTYCTCPAEESSGDAAMILARGGIPARALLGGLGAWTSLQYPIDTGLK